MSHPKHIVHMVYKLSTGGLENGLVNLVNHLPMKHTIVSLTDADSFKNRVGRHHEVICLNKTPGPLSAQSFKIIKLLKKLSPDILHTRNLSTIECQWMGWAAGIGYRIHSEHGRDSHDIEGTHKKSIRIRKLMKPFVHQYIALSKDLEHYLLNTIKVKRDLCHQIYNGVDTQRFKPTPSVRSNQILTAGRLDQVKNIQVLIKAFAIVVKHHDAHLNIVGDGPQMSELKQLSHSLKLQDRISFLGMRDDIPTLMAQANLYVQSSLFEGISNTILEAMSSGCCVVATRVGGNPELIDHGQNGFLVESDNCQQLSQQIIDCLRQPQLQQQMGHLARQKVCAQFSIEKMWQAYGQLYATKRTALCVA